MAVDTYTPLYSEILSKLSKIKSKKDKVSHLKHYNDASLRMVIKSSFDPKIKWSLPAGDVPYKANDAPEGTEHTMLISEARKLFHFIKGGNNQINGMKRESMFVQMLEGLNENEATLLIAAKDKSLHQLYKGLSKNVVMEAFNWDDNFMVIEQEQYLATPGSASGV
jgi:hypothetical protein